MRYSLTPKKVKDEYTELRIVMIASKVGLTGSGSGFRVVVL